MLKNKMRDYSIIAILAVILVIIFVVRINNGSNGENAGLVAEEGGGLSDLLQEEAPPPEPVLYRVYITGQVSAPGVYDIEEGGRVIDLIELAGGSLSEADLEHINLAAFVEDAKHIIIPRIGEELVLAEEPSVEDLAAEGVLVNINAASVAMLTSLPGVGPVIAQNIVDYRESYGPFVSIEEIKNVNRIGDSLFSQIEGYIIAE